MPIEIGLNMVYTNHVIKVRKLKEDFKMSKMFNVFVGLNDKDTKIQEVETDKALEIVKSLCWEMFEGATVSIAFGLYKHDNGDKVTENTIRIELMTDDTDKIKTLVNELKRIFNQESIMVTIINPDVCFW